MGGGCEDSSASNTSCADIRRKCLQGRDEIVQKAYRVVVPFVQRKPGDRPFATRDPFADQRGFTKASRGRDDCQFMAQTFIQLFDQPGAEDNCGRGGGIYSLVAKIGVGI